ncbi:MULTISPECIES: hypothetical protein [unclassified Nocardioides]|uniref:hypothetical protein n=1 Tax=unclassified Nocardioides TaxID=2615069 RepID=UPI0009EFE0DE|nr:MULTISPECIES: hypothetical protein [unclassified Nocardioides]GAW50819.1 hypothetical protein PD653B2_3155 [Nocardioides sp. PD653-B2]GAW52758.1 hypothetical protein PD653_0151 [Nocardioides sp. PD653]
MTPPRNTAAAVLAVAALLAAGCSSDSTAPEASPSTAATSAATTPSPSATSTPTPSPGAEDPIAFGSYGGVSCSEVQGPMLMVDQLEVLRPMTLTALDLPEADGIAIGDVTISRRRQGDLPLSGGWLGTEPADGRKDDLRWARRTPLAGARVAPGWYNYFLPLDIAGVARFRGVEISWQDDAGSGTSRQTVNETYRRSCA